MGRRPADFRKNTIDVLGRRCGFLCSNPACPLLTVGSHSDPNKSCTIGEACHIEAASEGGPRYNPNMTMEERRSIENGLWLCSNCSLKIDSDPDMYPVELLRRWKQQAEKRICLGNSTLKKITGNKLIIIAVTNIVGGVAKSFSSAALAYGLYKITKKKVLCISVAQLDNAPMALGVDYRTIRDSEEKNKSKLLEELDFINSPAGIDVVCRYSIEKNRLWQENKYGTSGFCRVLDYLIEKNRYSYIVCDCGRGDTSINQDIILNATDVIIPIGENSNSYRGIPFITYALQKNISEKNMWLLHTMGSYEDSHSMLYGESFKAKKLLSKINCVKTKDFTKIIPFNNEVDSTLSENGNIFEYERIRNVVEAYMEVVQELLIEHDENV